MKKAERDAIRNALWQIGDVADGASRLDYDNYYSGVAAGIGRAMDIIEEWPVDDEEGEE